MPFLQHEVGMYGRQAPLSSTHMFKLYDTSFRPASTTKTTTFLRCFLSFFLAFFSCSITF